MIDRGWPIDGDRDRGRDLRLGWCQDDTALHELDRY